MKEEKERGKQPKEDIHLEPPRKCPICEWVPPPQSVQDGPDFTKTWLIIQTPLPGVWFIICPECNGVSVNPNAVDNLKLLLERQNRKIITAEDEDRIVVPKLNMGGL